MSKKVSQLQSNTKPTSFDTILEKLRRESKTPSELGTRFEKITKDFLTTDKFYKNRFKKVWLWKEWPEREGSDIGIDLVAEEIDGRRCAIQCKCYADDGSLDLKHVGTFLSLAAGLNIENKILVYTGDKLTNHAQTVLRKNRCTIIQKEHLRSSSVDWSEFPKLKVKKPHTLYDFQENALDDVLTGFKKHDRGKLIMACGTGKTLVSLHVAEQAVGIGGLILYVVPSISLILQSMREWSDNANIKHYYVAVCSDKSAGGEEGSITELESPVSTDAKTLKPYLKTRPTNAMTVIFSTYNSIEVVKKAMKDEIFDIVFCDEAHRTTGIEDKSFYTFVHKDKNIPAKKRLYMTATPRVYSDQIKAKLGKIIYSMDDEKKYGPVFHRLNFTDAVQKYNALSDFKVKIAIVPEDKVDQDFQQAVAGEDFSMPLDEKTLLAAVWHGIQYPDDELDKPKLLQRVITFCNRIDRSKMFAGEMTDENDNKRSFANVVGLFNTKHPTGNHVEVKHIDGSHNALYRRDKMRWLAQSNDDPTTSRILSNAKCLSEGVDVPALDGVVFLNPRKSIVDVVQSVGRVMRKSPGKKFGYVILPVALPAGVEYHESLNNNETFKIVWQVLNALRAHDDKFGREVNSLILDKSPEVTSAITPRISVSILDERKDDRKPIVTMFDKIKSKLVQKVGEIDYYERYGEELGKAASTVEVRIRNMLKTSPKLEKELIQFYKELQKMINESVTKDESIRVISQHVILSKVFDELFSGEFTSHNPISVVLDSMAVKFGLKEELEELEDFYDKVKKEVSEIKTREARQNFIKTIYGNFFASTAKKETEQHGVVYTPVEIIDFIIQSVEVILNKNFGVGFNDRSVKVLDPFAGTGTFLTRLLESGLITDKMYEKFKSDLFANEMILLAYYIATVNVETTYSSIKNSGKYIPFEGINYTDTLRLNPQYREDTRHRQEIMSLGETFKIAHKRIRKQKGSHVHVIIGNPPYSKGQSTFSNYNPNLSYPQLDKRIQDTYAKKTETSNKMPLFDSYVRALRWASDRIGTAGVVSFVTNGSFIDSTTARGIRACLFEEFNEIWCFNLRGNQRTQGEISKQEGGKIFGSGSRAPVAIIFLIKNPKTKTHVLNYKDIGDYLTRSEKLQIIKNAKSIKGVKDWIEIKPNKKFDWINQRIDKFNEYTPMGIKQNKIKNENSIFKTFSLGIVTSRDSWVYNFSKKEISKNMNRFIEYCNKQNLNEKEFDKKIHDPKLVRWSYDLTSRLRKRKPVFDENKIRVALYRPFCKQFLYYDETFIERPRTFNLFFPEKNSKNITIIIPSTSGANFSPFITDTISDLLVLFNSVCFPLFVYNNEKKQMTSNITETTLEEFKTFYKDNQITKEDIFYYVYGLLHHKGYQKKYSANLGKEYPHIPMAPKFWNFSDSGKKLASLHLNYQDGKMYNLGNPKNKIHGKILKITFGRKKIKEKNIKNVHEIWVNGLLIFDNIPDSNYRVDGRTPLEWIVDRYRTAINSDNKIVNEPLKVDIVSLIKRIVFLSIESDKIINDLPKEFESSDWEPKKTGLEKYIK